MSGRLLLLCSALLLLFPEIKELKSAAQTKSAQTTSTPAAPLTARAGLLAPRIQEILAEPGAARAHWGIAVMDVKGTSIFQLDDTKFFRPASTAKLFTAAAAFALLGPDHHFTTGVYGDLDPATGTVQGDLVLAGGGDPSFGTEDLPYTHDTAPQVPSELLTTNADLEAISRALSDSGVKEVSGRIIGDDSLFEAPTVPQGWAEEDLLWGYGSLPSALSFQDNELGLTLELPPPDASPTASSGAAHAAPLLHSNQLYPYLQITNDVRLLPKGAETHAAVDAQQNGTPQAIRLFGTMEPDSAPIHQTVSVPDSSTYAAGALRAQLLKDGIEVRGGAEARHAPPTQDATPFLHAVSESGCEMRLWDTQAVCKAGCPSVQPAEQRVLFQHTSPPLAQEIAFTLKTSANLHAEVLLHDLAVLAGCSGASTAEGIRVMRSWLLHVGLSPEGMVMYDGSGLSTKDLVTPRAEAQLLAYAATQSWSAAWKAALPVGGVDGTLAARFTEANLKGRVQAKTGTLGESRALAGYVQTASGQELIVVILVDDHEPGNSSDRLAMDKIVSAIAELN